MLHLLKPLVPMRTVETLRLPCRRRRSLSPNAAARFPSRLEPSRGPVEMHADKNNLKSGTALIVCGALVTEVLELKAKHGWNAEVTGVPALLHNHPHILP